MRLIFAIFIFMVSFLFISCAHQPSYVEQLSARPYPTTQQDIDSECAWIRSEIARMNSLNAMSATSQFALAFQAIGRNNIAALESRAANLRCGAAFSSTLVIEKQNQTSSIDECIKACKENTNRTPEQCFDLCNK
jgi:hypothetical protein